MRPGSPLQAWLTIVGCMLTMTIVSGPSLSGLGVLAPDWIRRFALSSGEVMLVMTAISVLSGLGGIVVGMRVGRHSPRNLLLCGVVAGALALFFGAHARSFAMLLLGVVPLAAVANALTGPVVGQYLAVRNFARPGLAIAVVSMGLSCGAIVGPLVVAGLLTHSSWQEAMLGSAIIVAVLGVGIALGLVRGKYASLDRPMDDEATRAAIETADASTGAATSASASASMGTATDLAKGTAMRASAGTATGTATTRTPLGEIVFSSTFIGAVLFQFPLMALMAGTFFHLGLFYSELGADLLAAAGLMSASAAVGLAGTFAAGWLVDRVPHLLLQVVTFALMALAHGLLALSPSIATLPIAVIMLSLGNSVLFPLIPAIFARRFAPADFQRAIGLFQPVLYSTILGALVVGVAHDAIGRYPGTFRVLLPVQALVLAAILLLARRPRTSAAGSESGPTIPGTPAIKRPISS